MPRFDDGAIDMQELLRRLAEQVVNAVMDAEADQLCGGGANSRNGYRERGLATCVSTLTLRIPKLPGRRNRALPACGPRPRRRRRDARHRHPQGAEGSREDRRLQALEGPGERHRLEPGPGIEDLYGRPLEGSPVPYVWLDATYVKEPTRLRDCFPQDSQSNIIPKAYLKPSPTGA